MGQPIVRIGIGGWTYPPWRGTFYPPGLAFLRHPAEALLDAFAARAQRWKRSSRDAYIFMINGAKLRAPAAALALGRKLAV